LAAAAPLSTPPVPPLVRATLLEGQEPKERTPVVLLW